MEQKVSVTSDVKNITKVVHAVQSDTGRKLLIAVDRVDLTTAFVYNLVAKKPSGLSEYIPASYNASTKYVEATMTNQLLAEVGNVRAQLEITDTAGRVTSYFFYIAVDEAMRDDSTIESSNEFTALQSMINGIAVVKAEFDAAMSAVSTDTELTNIRVKADGTTATTAGNAVREQITELKDDLSQLEKVFTFTENLYNPYSASNKKGVCIALADGEDYSDSSTVNYTTSGFFDTNADDVWRFYRWNSAETSIHPLEIRIHWYNSAKEYISGSRITGYTSAPSGAKFMRFSENFSIPYPELKIMVSRNYDFGVNDYQPYGEVKKLKREYLPNSVKYELAQKHGTLHSGENWVIENNNIMARKVLALSAIISNFSSIEIGHGTKVNSPSSWIVIDATNLKVYSTPSQTVNLAHGLTIANTLQVLIEVGTNYKATITLISNGEKYVTEQDWDGNIGYVFVTSIGTVLTDCDVSWTCKNYKSPIWAYGDSYFGMTNSARWIAQLIASGYGTNMLIDGYPGRASADAYNSLLASLNHGKPKFILWAMGMNNPDNDSSVNADWLEKFNAVKSLCESMDMTLIACTIPNTPTQFHSYKNNVVRQSGLRYIDFAKAVNAEHIGDSWYSGMLSSDNVHPTEKGAVTLYMQAVSDFPELISE